MAMKVAMQKGQDPSSNNRSLLHCKLKSRGPKKLMLLRWCFEMDVHIKNGSSIFANGMTLCFREADQHCATGQGKTSDPSHRCGS